MSVEAGRKERIDRGIKVRSDGVYAISSWREMSYLIAPRLAFILGLLILPLAFYYLPYWQRVVSIICIYALLAISFDFLANYVGLVSLGGGFYVGVGAYIAALCNTKLDLSPLLDHSTEHSARRRDLHAFVPALSAASGCVFRNSQSHVSIARCTGYRGV